MEKYLNSTNLDQYLEKKAFEERIRNRMYEVLWLKEIQYWDNVITLETLKYRNWTVKDSFKNIRKVL